jgi:replicative DNA helicase
LIDSDGYVSREGTRITIAQGLNHEKLASDIIALVRSLGFMCNSRVADTQWTYEGELRNGKAICMNVSGNGVEDIPTRVARKKCSSPVKRDTTGTGNITVKQVEFGEFIGLAIDGNQRFVLSDFTVTHNCNIYSKRLKFTLSVLIR